MLTLTLVALELPGQSHPPTIAAQTAGVDLTSATSGSTCGALAALQKLLGLCGTSNATNGTDATSAQPTCNLLGQLLGTCRVSSSPTIRDKGGSGGTVTTTTPTTSPPPTTTTTTAAAPTPVVTTTQNATGSCAGTAPPVAAPGGRWACTFDDEFNGTSLDSSKWSPMLTYGSGYTTGPSANRACYVDSPQTISESGGYLDLSVVASAQPYNCQGTQLSSFQAKYLGGEVISNQKFDQQYGFFETRASMPPVDFPGLQDTLWLYPENETLYGNWPNSGEIDYGEWYSEYANYDFPANIFPGDHSDPNAETNTCTISGQSPAGQFHTYALLWTPTTLTSYFDGVPCLTDVYAPYVSSPDKAPEPFNQPFFIALTAALGWANGDAFKPGQTPLPGTMQVDWMRVWQYG